MAEGQTIAFNRNDLQELLKAVVREMKEPTPAEKARMEAHQAALQAQFLQAANLAKTEEETKARRWDACPHFEMYNGQQKHKWIGQVNSDGFVVPICNMCHVEAPKFSANLLPDSGKNGVNFMEWNWPPQGAKALLVELHKKSYPKGCNKPSCVACTK